MSEHGISERGSETPDLHKLSAGVYLCKICDIFTDEPNKHRHGEMPLE